MLQTPSRNLRYAIRRLAASPGFTVSAVLSLAIGIGANTAIFSLVDQVILREKPFERPEELVEIYESNPDFPWRVFSYPDYRDVLESTDQVFAGVSGTRLVLAQVDIDGQVSTVGGEAVTGSYFSLPGIQAALGRTLLPEDEVAPGGHPVVVLGYAYWQSAFDGEASIVGRVIRLSGRPYTIVGVVSEAYRGHFRGIVPAFYAPIMMVNELQPGNINELEARRNHSMFVRGRLRPGVSMIQAQAALDGTAARLTDEDPADWDPDTAFTMVPTSSVLLFPPFDRFIRAASWLLVTVAGLVLLLACTNLASFLLARAVDRRKEIAIRLSLGASRRTLIGQLLTESVVLGLVGGLAGVGVALGLLRLLLNADLPIPVPVTLDPNLDATVLTFSLMISIVSGLALGLVPAVQSTNPDVAPTLKDESAGAGRPGRLRLRGGLVVAQVAASLLLLVGAGLFLRSFQGIQTVDPGFGHEPAAILRMIVPSSKYDEENGRTFVRRLMDRYAQLPGVDVVATTDNLHLNTLNTQNSAFNVDGVEPPPGREWHLADRATVSPSFFDAVGIRIVDGRNFDDSLDTPDTRQAAIISQVMATRFWPDGNAVGSTIRRPSEDGDFVVVGVASDAKVRSLGEEPRAMIYRAYSQSYTAFTTVVARTSGDAEQLSLQLLSTAREMDPDLWFWEATTMARHLGIQQLPARLSAVVLTAFATLALLLACVGLYGIVSYGVAQRTREVGIRMSLGADRASVVRLLMGGGFKLVLVGSALGLGLAVVANRVLSGLLFGVGTFDPLTFIMMPLVLLAAALVAAWVPARRASRIDPAVALRTE